MRYAGLIDFNNHTENFDKLESTVKKEIFGAPKRLKIDSLMIFYECHSKLHNMDKVLINDSSILLGRVFKKSENLAIKNSDFKNWSYSTSEKVLTSIWGKYVYINSKDKGSHYEIVVDLAGQLPFFYHPFSSGNILFSSHIEIIANILSRKLDYNWPYLNSYQIFGNSSSIETPFKDVFEVPPSCRLIVSKNTRSTELFWNPQKISSAQKLHENEVVETLKSTLKPLINPYKNICVSLSGGLDSSSLVYCLKDIIKNDQSLTALNHFHSALKSTNELTYARKVCNETGIKLIEMDVSHLLPFDLLNNKSNLKPNKPFPGLVSLNLLEAIREKLPNDGPSTFISGHGSDNIFMCPPSTNLIVDHILEKGFKNSISLLKDVSEFYREPIFPILKANLASLANYLFSKRSHKRDFRNIQYDIPEWINNDLTEMVSPNFIHPVYKCLTSKIFPGKYEQIDALYEGLASIHMEDFLPNPMHHPFLYEPIVALALGFPTYSLFQNGYDRFPLRKAVSNYYKSEVAWRTYKSQTTGILQLGVKKNLNDILDLCLEGQFTKQGFIDKDGLQKTILRIASGDIQHLWPFIHIASAEIFIKHWEECLS